LKRALIIVSIIAIGLSRYLIHTEALNQDEAPKLTSSSHQTELPQAKRKIFKSSINDNREFHEIISRAYQVLPRVEVLRIKRDLTRAPTELLKAGEPFAQIGDALKQDPSLAPQALEFYQACVGDEDFLFAIRALCLRDLRYWTGRVRGPGSFDESQFPEALVRAEKILPRDFH
jgi:hypothetical protein